jgi:DNA-binding transcriptional regulator YdaS (Cro superfamily)
MPDQVVCDAVQRAVDLFGSERALGRACGVSQQAIHKAKATARISPELAMAIHCATGGMVTGSELRPDLWRHARDVPIERLNGGRRKRA